MQRILLILISAIVAAGITLVYLSISERMTDVSLRIQLLQEERSQYSRDIADLTTEEGILTSYRTMQERAERMGFMDIDFYNEDEYAFVVVDGYTGTGINTVPEEITTREPEMVSLIRPEYTESLQEWLMKRISTGIESYEVTN